LNLENLAFNFLQISTEANVLSYYVYILYNDTY